MQEFGNFLAHNWLQIISILMTVAVLIIGIIKGNKKIVSNAWTELLEQVGNCVPKFVIEAEGKHAAGVNKAFYVIDHCLSTAKDILGAELTDVQAAQVINMARTQLELVLTAPTKKGGIGRGEEE